MHSCSVRTAGSCRRRCGSDCFTTEQVGERTRVVVVGGSAALRWAQGLWGSGARGLTEPQDGRVIPALSSFLPVPSLVAAGHSRSSLPLPCPALVWPKGCGVCVRPARAESSFLGTPAIVLFGEAFLYPNGPGRGWEEGDVK